LHWHLNVTFKEDASRAKKGYVAANLATLRKLSLQIISAKNDKLSLKKTESDGGFQRGLLETIVAINFVRLL
jgi:hypothetical protein